MKKILIIDVENIIFNTKSLNLQLIEYLAKKTKYEVMINELEYNNNFYSFHRLYNKYFNKLNLINKSLFYLRNYKYIYKTSFNNYHKALKNDDVVFLIQELKDMQNSESRKILYTYWDNRTKKFMHSKDFRKKYHLNINKNNSYKWPLYKNMFNPNLVIKELAEKNIAIENVILLSNDVRLLRFMNSLGMKTLSWNNEPQSLQSLIANKNIIDLLTTNLIEILNDLN